MLICKPVECLPEASGFVGVSEKKYNLITDQCK